MLMNYSPPLYLRSGLVMTIYGAYRGSHLWQKHAPSAALPYQQQVFIGANDTPIFGLVAQHPQAKGTVIATYGITGTLENQWFLETLTHKAYARGYSVVIFDWRFHGQTAALSPALTSDGIYEGEDFVRIAAASKQLGCPAPFFFAGYSLGAQLALWGIKAAQELDLGALGLELEEIAGVGAVCPSLESHRSLCYLEQHPLKTYLEKAIAKTLRGQLAEIIEHHPQAFPAGIMDRISTIRDFDRELVIPPLGFATTQEYYEATSPIYFLEDLQRPTFILYAEDDPLFIPSLVDDLKAIAPKNPQLKVQLTQYGGHVGYISSTACQQQWQDPDPWWAWNRVLDWFDQQQVLRCNDPANVLRQPSAITI